MSAGPGMKTYASASSTAFHSWLPTFPSFDFGRVVMDRHTVGSSSNRSIGRAPAARSWYTNSAATGRPWFQVSTITFSFGLTCRAFLITFFASASYSDMLRLPPGETERGLNLFAFRRWRFQSEKRKKRGVSRTRPAASSIRLHGEDDCRRRARRFAHQGRVRRRRVRRRQIRPDLRPVGEVRVGQRQGEDDLRTRSQADPGPRERAPDDTIARAGEGSAPPARDGHADGP